MRIIQIKEDQKDIWNEFIAENCSESFLQSWEWGEFNCVLGKKVWRLGITEDGLLGENKIEESRITNHESEIKLLAVILIIKYDLPFGWSYLYCPRGPVIDESQITNHRSQISNMLFGEIKKIAKEEKSLFLKIDPPAETNYEYFSKFKKSPNEVQPKNTLMLDLEKPEEDLLKEMKQKTRYNIRLAGKKGIRITNYELRMDNKKLFKEKFEKFWELVKETSKRDKFVSHNKNYYCEMLESLGKTQNKIQDTRYKNQKNINNQISKNKQNLQAKLYLAEYKNKIIVANIVLYFGDVAIYLHGTSSNEYRNAMAPYLLQWQQILDAKKVGCKKYDFWGIASKSKIQNPKFQINSKFPVQDWSASDRKIQNSWQGITRFKKGFGGYEKNYIGAYDLIFDNIGYTIYKFIRKIRGLI